MDRKLICAAALALLSTASGGVIPEGMGAWDNGARDPVPSSKKLRWTTTGPFTAEEFDWVAFGMASLDIESTDAGILFMNGRGGATEVWVKRMTDPVDPACLDDDESTSCLLGKTICESWGEFAGSSYQLCNLFRVRIYVDNLYARAVRRGIAFDDALIWLIRHEMGHVLGFPHDEGPMTAAMGVVVPLTPCQLAKLRVFTVDPLATEWVYAPEPQECQ